MECNHERTWITVPLRSKWVTNDIDDDHIRAGEATSNHSPFGALLARALGPGCHIVVLAERVGQTGLADGGEIRIRYGL